MIEWTLSKAFISIFTAGLILFAATVFSIQMGKVHEQHLDSVASKIASKVNELAGSRSNTSFNFTYSGVDGQSTGESGEGIILPYKIADSRYYLRFSSTSVTVYLKGEDAEYESASFRHTIHVWDPDNVSYMTTEEELKNKDMDNINMTLPSGPNFTVTHCELLVEGEIQYHTFLYRDA